MVKKTYKVGGMHCSSCAMTIEWSLEDLGVKAKCNYVAQTLKVDYDPKKLDEKKIKETVKTAGYSVVE